MSRSSRSSSQSGNNCKVATFIPFTDTRDGPFLQHANPGWEYYGYGTWPSPRELAKASYSLMATAQMAADHFNARNPSIVPELGDFDLQYSQCNITMPDHIYLNSGYDRGYAVSQMRKLLEEEAKEGRDSDNAFCAVVGPVDSFGEDGISVFSEDLSIPQLAYETIASKLSNREEYPTLARVITDAYDFGSTFPKFFHRDIWKREAIAVLYDNTDYGKQFMVPMEEMATQLGYEVLTQFFVQGVSDSIDGALMEILEQGYRTIVVVTDQLAMLDDIAQTADTLNMLGEGYFWMLTNEALQPVQLKSIRYVVDSPADKLLRGAALFTNYDPFVYQSTDDPFLLAWRSQNTSSVSKLNQLQPLDSQGEPYFLANESYFLLEVPTEYASFMFDAVISIGISACRMLTTSTNSTNDSFMDAVFSTDFTGASGKVQFKRESNNYSNSRDPSAVQFGIYNIQPGIVDINGMQR
jgi:Receptor family ligand binding region